MLVSIADDKSIKIFDVANIDMMAMLRLSFLPGCAAWIFKVILWAGCPFPVIVLPCYSLSRHTPVL